MSWILRSLLDVSYPESDPTLCTHEGLRCSKAYSMAIDTSDEYSLALDSVGKGLRNLKGFGILSPLRMSCRCHNGNQDLPTVFAV
jgi:hypothetical protein